MKRLAIVLAVFMLASCASNRYPSGTGYSSSGGTASDSMANGDGNDLYQRNGAASGVYVPDVGTYGLGGP